LSTGLPSFIRLHPNLVQISGFILPFLISAVLLCTGCTQQQPTPDQIRQKTAETTAELKNNARAFAQGVKEGLSSNQPLNTNKARKEELERLPEIDGDRADRIIASRPYDSADQPVSRHILSEVQYRKIKDAVTATQ
jgi:DNA uptake protein ComE-like DNA-binding protein